VARLRAAIGVAALVVGAVCLAGALLALGGRFDPWLDLLAHFAPVWLAGAAGAGVAGVVAPRGRTRGAVLIVAALGALAAGALMAPEWLRTVRPPVAAAPPARIRLVEFNTWDRNSDPEATAAWIESERPDIVAVEEGTPALRRALARRGYAYVKGMVSTAIFSRLPRAPSPFAVPAAAWHVLPDFARATYAAPEGSGTFSVVAVHLNWPTRPSSWAQIPALLSFLNLYAHDRLIVAGDFNLTPWSFALRRLDRDIGLERRDRALASWPVRRRLRGRTIPLPTILPIDHIYAGPGWRTVDIRLGPRLGSDHLPLIVDLAARP
jgi:endonuclease/exonuclease/phosphatase (EEP) superfamily protein YafD